MTDNLANILVDESVPVTTKSQLQRRGVWGVQTLEDQLQHEDRSLSSQSGLYGKERRAFAGTWNQG